MNSTPGQDAMDNDRFPSATRLSDSRDVFVRAIRKIQRDADKRPAFFNSSIEQSDLGFDVSALGDGRVVADITGKRAVSDGHGLDQTMRDRLVRRGWTLPEHRKEERITPTRKWDGVTSQTDRKHIASEILSVAIEVYSLPKDLRLHFRR